MTRIVDLCFHIPSPSLPRVPKKSNRPSSVDNNVGNDNDNNSGGDDGGNTLEVVAQRWSAEPEVHDQSMMREDASTVRRFLCCLNGNIEDLCVESFNSLMAAGYSHEIGEWLDRPLSERASQSLQYLNFLESFHTFRDGPKEPVTSTKHFNRQDIVTVQRLKTAVQFVFPGELSKLAIEAGENSIDLLRSELVENVAMNHQDQDEDDEEEEEVSMDFLLNDFKQYKAQQQELRPQRPSVEGRNRAEQPPGETQDNHDDEEEETEDEKNLSAVMYTLGCMTKLAFPVCAMGETLTKRISQPTSLYAAVFLSSVFQ
jgi:hypothetical protein